MTGNDADRPSGAERVTEVDVELPPRIARWDGEIDLAEVSEHLRAEGAVYEGEVVTGATIEVETEGPVRVTSVTAVSAP